MNNNDIELNFYYFKDINLLKDKTNNIYFHDIIILNYYFLIIINFIYFIILSKGLMLKLFINILNILKYILII